MCATVIIWSILSCIHLLSPPQTLASYWPPCSNSTIATSPSISPTDAPMIPGTIAMGLWANSWLYCQSVLLHPTARILTLMQILQFAQKLSIPWHIFYLLWICISEHERNIFPEKSLNLCDVSAVTPTCLWWLNHCEQRVTSRLIVKLPP